MKLSFMTIIFLWNNEKGGVGGSTKTSSIRPLIGVVYLFLLPRNLYCVDAPDVLAGLGTEPHPKRTTKRLYYQPSLKCHWYAPVEI